jgi:beta-ribofuranosylaminobenzene 5'-phosphate synthase
LGNMRVEVETPARLHMGIIELGGHLGTLYGGIGVAVKPPALKISVEKSEKLEIVGPYADVVREVVMKMSLLFNLDVRACIKVWEAIPAHRGFGSTTQLTLAVATALSKLYGLETPVEILARLLGRRRISNVGTAVFKAGGFVLDLPRKTGTDTYTVFQQRPFPENWAFAVAYPEKAMGPDERSEEALFAKLKPMELEFSQRLSHLVLCKLLPSLVCEDVVGFGEALTEIQRILGNYFSEVQGGVFYSNEAVELLEKLGAKGVGQSSWGPAAYGLYPTHREAEVAVRQLAERLGEGWKAFAALPQNRGATVSVTSR